MNVIEALNARYSCRDFDDKPVNKDIIEKIMLAALRSPSWENTQPWDVYIAGYETSKRIIAAFTGNPTERGKPGLDIGHPGRWTPEINMRIKQLWPDIQACCEHKNLRDFSILNKELFHAPCMIYVCMDKSLGIWSIFDIGIFCQSVMLAAEEYGLKTIPAIAYVNYPEIVRRELDIPEQKAVVFGIGIGYPNEKNPINTVKTKRKGLDEIVFKD